MLYIFSGENKGKSTSAIGLITRAWGHNKKIFLCQFLKGKDAVKYGEIVTLNKLNELRENSITIQQSGSNRIVLPQNKTDDDKLEAIEAWIEFKNSVNNSYDIVIIDELLPCLQLELLPFRDVYKWLQNNKDNFTLVVTGRIYNKRLKEKLEKIADLYSDIACIKHPFNRKCKQCNVEFDNFRYNYCPFCATDLTKYSISLEGVEF